MRSGASWRLPSGEHTTRALASLRYRPRPPTVSTKVNAFRRPSSMVKRHARTAPRGADPAACAEQECIMSIREFCVRDVVCTSRTATITQVAALMREHHVGDVVVVDDDGKRKVPVGILTDRDIVVAIVAADVIRAGLPSATSCCGPSSPCATTSPTPIRCASCPSTACAAAGGRRGRFARRHHLGRRHPAPAGGAAGGVGRAAEA